MGVYLPGFRCFLDLDGVLVDMAGATLAKYGITEPCTDWGIYKTVGLEHDELFAQLDYEFWRDLPKSAEFDGIMRAVSEFFEPQRICLLTAPVTTADFPHIPAGKFSWIRRQMPEFSRSQFLIGPGKQFCAGPSSVLIDDADHNCNAFTAEGGSAVLIPRAWNKAGNPPEDMYAYVWSKLHEILVAARKWV